MSGFREDRGWWSRGYLPHFDGRGIVQTVTIRLEDSVPRALIEHWRHAADPSTVQGSRRDAALAAAARVERYADQGRGACWLREPQTADMMQETLLRRDGVDYNLLEWCVMPNHLHALLEVDRAVTLRGIVAAWKSVSAHQINKLHRRNGRVWMPEYFDRYVRDGDHFEAAIRYIRDNPVRAGLAEQPRDWPWSSAGYRAGRH